MEQKVTLRQRLFALSVHLGFSVLLLGLALFMVFGIWYPAPLDYAAGVNNIYWMLLSIDLILGPLLTFVVFKHDRKKFIFDMVIIIAIQLSAYFYGLNTMYQGRPAWLVYVIDDFELIRPVDIADQDWKTIPDKFALQFLKGPQWIGANYSSNSAVMKKQKEDELFEGISLAQKPVSYVLLGEKFDQIQKSKHKLSELNHYNRPEKVQGYLRNYPSADSYIPVKGIDVDITALMDRENRFVGAVPLTPWKD